MGDVDSATLASGVVDEVAPLDCSIGLSNRNRARNVIAVRAQKQRLKSTIGNLDVTRLGLDSAPVVSQERTVGDANGMSPSAVAENGATVCIIVFKQTVLDVSLGRRSVVDAPAHCVLGFAVSSVVFFELALEEVDSKGCVDDISGAFVRSERGVVG